MHLIYRISDSSYVKPKLPGSSKEVCLKNFLWAFKDIIFTPSVMNGARPSVTIIADRVKESKEIISATGLPVIYTDLGNAGSLMYALDYALAFGDDEVVYFCEDDYLHLPNAGRLLLEGIGFSDYVTLYDHPDKYTSVYDFGETSKVIRTSVSHWRFTQSTCMTFGAKVDVLRRDIEVWKSFVDGNHPHDHKIFSLLREGGRKLAVCIPGVACHMDMTFSGHAHELLMDDWALELLYQEIEGRLSGNQHEMKKKIIKDSMTKWDRLKMISALVEYV